MAEYGSLVDHATAFMTRLRAQVTVDVYPEASGGPTTVPAGTEPPYVVVQFVADRPTGTNLQQLSTRFRMRAYCQCVGANDLSAQAVSDEVSDAVLDYVLTITGRAVFPIRLDVARDPLASDTTGATTVTITDVYRLESEPGRDAS